MTWPAADAIKQQIPLLDYLKTQNWKPARRAARGQLMGLCPLHFDHQPSFLLDPVKNLFYCYGCGRGGDLIRFVELFHGVTFIEAMMLLRNLCRSGSLLSDVARFYQLQLHRHSEAVAYLQERGINQPQVIEKFGIGYAPGRCLRSWLIRLGYALAELQQAGLVNSAGLDTFSHRIVFPLENNLYGRSIGSAAAHRFLPGAKGGLYDWEQIRHYPEIILVEGLLDLAVLYQAGFLNATCAMGSRLNTHQFRQLCEGAVRTVYIAFDCDANGSGQQAAQQLSRRLLDSGVIALRVALPPGHDPNSFFTRGGDRQQFQQLLAGAVS